MSVKIITADVLDGLAQIAGGSVHCCVTSPPYYGLRDYGVAGQIGLEPTLAEYLAKMVAVFREVRRVLRDDGTLWLNIGDSYCSTDKWGGGGNTGRQTVANDGTVPSWAVRQRKAPMPGIKPKDLIGVPWMLAFALRADGWHLRQDIIWHKPNPMPESVRDRCTKAHEYIFLFSKSARYYYDADAIAEPVTLSTVERVSHPTLDEQAGSDRVPGKTNGPMKAVLARSGNKARKPASERGVPVDTNGGTNGAVAGSVPWEGATANKRSVWTVTTKPFKEAHFATFPPEIPELCIKAGCPAGGTVLDPFLGSGTTALVADRLQRSAIGIELNPDYAAMAERRIRGDAPLFAEVE